MNDAAIECDMIANIAGRIDVLTKTLVVLALESPRRDEAARIAGSMLELIRGEAMRAQHRAMEAAAAIRQAQAREG